MNLIDHFTTLVEGLSFTDLEGVVRQPLLDCLKHLENIPGSLTSAHHFAVLIAFIQSLEDKLGLGLNRPY